MSNGVAETLIKTAKLDSQTIVHLILIAILAWLIFIFVPDLMESHREDMKEMSGAVKQIGEDHKEAMDKVVEKLDTLLHRHD